MWIVKDYPLSLPLLWLLWWWCFDLYRLSDGDGDGYDDTKDDVDGLDDTEDDDDGDGYDDAEDGDDDV